MRRTALIKSKNPHLARGELRNFAVISEDIFFKLSSQDTNSFRWQGSSDEDCCTPLFCSQYETKAESFRAAPPSGCTCFIIFQATQFPQISSGSFVKDSLRILHVVTFVPLHQLHPLPVSHKVAPQHCAVGEYRR